MSARTLISVEDYLASSYEPDCDYVDDHIEERNLGEVTHARLQTRLSSYLHAKYEEGGIVVMTEVRVQVRPSRFRVPDVCVTVGEPGEEVLTKPPFVCIGILSPEDRMSRIEVSINDYLTMGVPYVWVLDPETKQAFIATASTGLQEVKSGVLKTDAPALEVPLSEIFR
jgi:Uma2 family endonuclease